MRDFESDNKQQRRFRDEILVPHVYNMQTIGGQFVLLDKGRLALRLQKELGIDTIVQTSDGGVVAVEEKIDWKGYATRNFALETKSCTKKGHESDGWMVYSEADYLLYCFVTPEQGLDCYLIDFPKLKDWFWPIHEQFNIFGPLSTLNRTMGRLVPIATVPVNVPTWQMLLPAAGREVAA